MLQMLTPEPKWLWVQSDQPFAVPQSVLEIPGVRYTEPDPGYAIWRCEVPYTAWSLTSVDRWLQALGSSEPALAGPVCQWSEYTIRAFNTLYAHQQKAVRFLLARPNAVLGDAPGLGKTRSALTAAAVLRDTRDRQQGQYAAPSTVLLVGPKFVRGVWRSELQALHLEGADRFVAIDGTRPPWDRDPLAGASWIYCHFDVLYAWWSQILAHRPSVVVIDEAHIVKNGKTRRGHAASLAASIAPYRFILTGTPVESQIGDLWYLLDLASGRWTWGDPGTFRRRYAGAYFDGHGLRDGEPTHTEELRRRLESCYIRRTKEDAGIELPSKTRQVVEVDLSEADLARYRELVGLDVRQHVRAILERRAGAGTIKWLGRIRKFTAKVKESATIEDLRSTIAQGESAVCFTWQRTTAERIARHVGGVAVHGGDSASRRETLVEEFQARGGCLVATIDALGVGVTLHKASTIVMHDLDWVPAKMLQGEDRVHRIGQVVPVLSKWMVAKGTLDEMLVRALLKKAPRIEQATGDGEPQSLADVLGEYVDTDPGSLDSLVEWAKEG